MKKTDRLIILVIIVMLASVVCVYSQSTIVMSKTIVVPILLPPFPETPVKQSLNSVEMGDWRSFPEIKLDIPITPGPFEPNWESIQKNYPGEPEWLCEAKFGIWVHFGP